MRTSWPPSPSVEDEAIALAREHCVNHTNQHSKNEDQPALCRGSVDQYPVILELSSGASARGPRKGSQKATREPQSSDESAGPPTPPSAPKELRYVYIPVPDGNAPSMEGLRSKLEPRSQSTTRLETERGTRGRPQVSRINTEVDESLKEMVTGRRRAPSPYSFKPETTSGGDQTRARESKASFLSPVDATAPRPTDHRPRKSRSAHPKQTVPDSDSSEHEHHKSRRRDRSGRSSTRQRNHEAENTRSNAQPVADVSVTYSKTGPANSRPRPETDRRVNFGDRTPPRSPRSVTESPYHSTAEDSEHHRSPRIYNPPGRKLSRDSERPSSVEDQSHRDRNPSKRVGNPSTNSSRRNSLQRRVKSGLDLSGLNVSDRDDQTRDRHRKREDRHYNQPLDREPGTPVSARTSKTMEELVENAFRENQKRHATYASRRSANPSPFASPPISPPHTPRGDRRSKDYFELSPSAAQPPKQRTRPTSTDESFIRPLTSLLEAATLGAASLAAKAIPSLSRSSSGSLETSSSGSQSKTVGASRSRKASAVFEEPRPLSRASSFAGNEPRQVPPAPTYPIPVESRQTHGSSQVQYPEVPRPLSRAFSYSSFIEPTTARPIGPSRTLSYIPTGPKSKAWSPTSVAALQAIPSLPPCPRGPELKTGFTDWYTIRHLTYMHFCPSCMKTLGSSPFRESFIPSPSHDRNRPTQCAMAHAWIRLAWVQTIKLKRPDLRLLQELSSDLPQGVAPCQERRSSVRQWWHLEDPKTKRPVPEFDVCSDCVRNIDILFPELKRHLFDRPKDKLSQERVCNMSIQSKYFPGLINGMDRLAAYCRSNDLLPEDIQEFVNYVRKVSRFKECAKDVLMPNWAWHYMPRLPEFTICEECFDAVVWPVKDKPIAREISKTKDLVHSLRNGPRPQGASCQLYSERMRGIFLQSVSNNDFELLRHEARLRYETEQRLYEMHKLIEKDQMAGIDRRAIVERNNVLWKSVE